MRTVCTGETAGAFTLPGTIVLVRFSLGDARTVTRALLQLIVGRATWFTAAGTFPLDVACTRGIPTSNILVTLSVTTAAVRAHFLPAVLPFEAGVAGTYACKTRNRKKYSMLGTVQADKMNRKCTRKQRGYLPLSHLPLSWQSFKQATCSQSSPEKPMLQ